MTDSTMLLLAANIGDIVWAIMALLVPILWVIRQITEASKQDRRPGGDVPADDDPLMEPPVARAAAGPQAAGQQADPLRAQVEDFLRRSGRHPQGDRAKPLRQDIEILLDDEPVSRQPSAEPLRAEESRTGTTGKASIPGSQASAGPPQKPQHRPVTPKKRKSLAERATERAELRASKMARQTSHLGQRSIADDAQFDVQLKARFDHTLGASTLGTGEEVDTTTRPVENPAAQIAAMLASPDGVRQAIVLNEILQRPSDLW